MPKSIYDSAWQHPGIAFVAAALFAVAWARRSGGVAGLATLLLVEIVADAFFTGAYSPLGGSPLATPVAILFVILGDLRFFLLVQLALRDGVRFEGLGSPKAWAAALAWALVIPVLSTVPQKLAPSAFVRPNAIFLLYEGMFVVLALVLRLVVLPARLASLSAPVRRWVLGLVAFELVQYALWATADVLILAGVEAGYLLRIVPNALYYGAFVPFAVATAPR